MLQFILLNIASHAVSGLPIFVLFRNRQIFHVILFFSVYAIVSIHGMIPFQHPVLNRQLDNTLTCLLFSFVATFVISNPAADILLPMLTLAFYIGVILGRFNHDMAAFAIESAIVTGMGLQQIYTRKSLPRIKDWRIVVAAIAWTVSNFFYLAFSNDSYVEIVHRVVTAVVFSFIAFISGSDSE